jgi:hypothetical protein
VTETPGYAAGQQGFDGVPADQPPPGYGPPPQQPGYGPAPYGYPYPAPYPMAMPQQPRSNMALTGMILGIVGLCTSVLYVGGVIGIVGLIFSIIGIRAVNRAGLAGKGMAITGLITSIIAIIVNAIEIAVIIWVVHTFNGCSQYDPNAQPTQYQQCVHNGIIGN